MIVSLVLDSVASLVGAQGVVRKATLSGGFLSFTGTIGESQVELSNWRPPVREVFRGEEVYRKWIGGQTVQFVNEYCTRERAVLLTAHQLRKIAALDPGAVIFSGGKLFIGGVEVRDVDLIRGEFPRSIEIIGNW